MSDRLLQEIRDELVSIQRTATIALEKLARLGAGFAPAPTVPRVPVEGTPSAVSRVRDALPGDLHAEFTIVDQGSGLVTITSKWLGSADWGRVDRAVKGMGGRWIPAGKSSRWEVEGVEG